MTDVDLTYLPSTGDVEISRQHRLRNRLIGGIAAVRSRSSVALSALACVLLCGYFLALWEPRALFFSNQNTYFLQGLRLAGLPGLQSDWVANTRAPHIAFSMLVAVLQWSGTLATGVRAIEIALYAAMIWSFWRLAQHEPAGALRTLPVRFIACGLFVILMVERGMWTTVFHWTGLAEQYIYDGYLQPSEFGIAIFVALALLVMEKELAAVLCLAIAADLHVSYLIPCALIAAMVAVMAATTGRLRSAVILLVAFGVAVAPFAAYAASFRGDPAAMARANEALAREIIPRHAWPAVWFSAGSVRTFVVMIVGTLLAWRHLDRRVAAIMTASLVLIAAGTAWVYVTENTFIALLFPWRASAYLQPLALLSIVLAVADTGTGIVQRVLKSHTDRLLAACACILALVIGAEAVRVFLIQRPHVSFPFAVRVAAQTSPDDVIIIPVAENDLWNRFRLLTDRPVFVDHKSHPYLAAEVLEWRRRRDAVLDFYRLPDALKPTACRDLGAQYYVATSRPQSTETTNDDLSLVRCSR